jgi:DNA-binding NarL/FixJ family response regulator
VRKWQSMSSERAGARAAPTRVDEARKKVLVIVEDEADMRAVIRAMLSADPRLEIVGEATSADEAVKIARTVDPGLIVLDHKIDGDVTGLEAAPMLKAVAPSAKILLFTAYDMRNAAEREPAIDAYLRKDSIGQLLPLVQDLLGLNQQP